MREQNEELQAQLLSNHVQEGRSLLMNGSTSLADEIENLPKDEVRIQYFIRIYSP